MISLRSWHLPAALLVLAISTPSIIFSQVPSFPGAEGFGATATGGRGGSVIQVTNLNDSGAGSLRAAINASGRRTVVFRVSGTIHLQSDLEIRNGHITIAGQTAPGDGITIRNFPLQVQTDNVIIRFIRSRLGDQLGAQEDAMNGTEQDRVILDHCSMSWSVDECASFYDNTNFTMQYCILSESLYNSIHNKGYHGYGGIWGGQGVTFHHNLFAHHSSRNPRFNGSRYSGRPDLELVDYRNNVIYNWGGNSAYGGEAGDENIVANYYKYGPATNGSVRDRIFDPDKNDNGYGYTYVAENVTEGYPATTENNRRGIDGVSETIKDEILLDEPLEAPALTPHTAYEAYEHVLAFAGAVLPARDAVDERIVEETLTGTATFGGVWGEGKGIIDSQETVGGWPMLESTEAPADSDHDGMPDEWEDAMGLDKDDPADRNDDQNGNGYTNLEDYLNSLVEAFAYLVRPVEFQMDTIDTYAVSLVWKDISDNESGFILERNEGEGWTELASLPAGTEAYIDESIAENGVYSYRMKAVGESLESFYTDSIVADIHVGLKPGVSGDFHLKVFPNPVQEEARIQLLLPEEGPVSFALTDLTGKKVLESDLGLQHAGQQDLSMDVSGLPMGIYFLCLSAGPERTIEKIVIAND